MHDMANLSRDCIRPPVPTSWFLPHAGPHLATAHFQSQELGHGMRYRTISVLIPATPENISVPTTTASITLITVSWS